MKTKETKLQAIINKYCECEFNQNNYAVGGGLDGSKFASNRHEDARSDSGKLTEGEATQLFKKATGLDIEIIRDVINYAVPNMEWHHAGLLPKKFGGGMKKTYFLNAPEICDIATNFETYLQKLELSKIEAKNEAEIKKEKEAIKVDFLKANAIYKERTISKGIFFIETNCEMNGKYGWFCSYGKSYNMTGYYTGWEFSDEAKYLEYRNL